MAVNTVENGTIYYHFAHINFNNTCTFCLLCLACVFTLVVDSNYMFILPGLQSEGRQIENTFVPAANGTCFLSVQSGSLLTQDSEPLAVCPCTSHPAWTLVLSKTEEQHCTLGLSADGGIEAARKDQILPCSRLTAAVPPGRARGQLSDPPACGTDCNRELDAATLISLSDEAE